MKILIGLIIILGLLGSVFYLYKQTIFPTVSTSEISGLGSISVGDSVTHPKFGEGIIKKIQDPNEGVHLIEVDFSKVGIKFLVAEHANLKKT